MNPITYLAMLTVDDVPWLQKLEDDTHLSFWGADNYRRFLGEFPEYYGCKAIVIRDGGSRDLIGFYLARSLFENLEILKVGVDPGYQRQGIGTQLMGSAYAEGIRRGCKRCFLEVRKSNENAIRFYQNHKFKLAGTRLDYYSNPVEDAWIMERDL
jgi:ribosomal-protein-alanine acetyltransferase